MTTNETPYFETMIVSAIRQVTQAVHALAEAQGLTITNLEPIELPTSFRSFILSAAAEDALVYAVDAAVRASVEASVKVIDQRVLSSGNVVTYAPQIVMPRVRNVERDASGNITRLVDE